jgi:hypothetical protein
MAITFNMRHKKRIIFSLTLLIVSIQSTYLGAINPLAPFRDGIVLGSLSSMFSTWYMVAFSRHTLLLIHSHGRHSLNRLC